MSNSRDTMRRFRFNIARASRTGALIVSVMLCFAPTPLRALPPATATTACAAQAPLAPRRFVFPRDDGKHDGYTIEAWRTFGRLHDGEGDVFDFGVNVSRTEVGRCYAGEERASNRHSPAHVLSMSYILLDEQTRHVERGMRVEREGPIGGSIASGILAIATDRVRYAARTHGTFDFALRDGDPNALSLHLLRSMQPIALGPGGVTTTGSCEECEAYAYAVPRNLADGTLRIAGSDHRVSGSAWFEHEFAHHELGPVDAGWSRYEVVFDDGRLADVRIARNFLGKPSAVAGVFVRADGNVTYLSRGDAGAGHFGESSWTSQFSLVEYDDTLTFGIGPAKLGLFAEEVAQDQEIHAIGRRPYYWGAIEVQTVEGTDRGHGFVELTGFGHPVFL